MIIESIQKQSQISSFSPICRNSFLGLFPKQDIFSISYCDISLWIRVSSAPASLGLLPGTAFTWRPLESQPFLTCLHIWAGCRISTSNLPVQLNSLLPGTLPTHYLQSQPCYPGSLLRITNVPCSTMCLTTNTTFLTSAGPSRQSCNAFSPVKTLLNLSSSWQTWPYRPSGHEFEQIMGDSEGQGSLACCGTWACKESRQLSDRTSKLNQSVSSVSHCTSVPKGISSPLLSR